MTAPRRAAPTNANPSPSPPPQAPFVANPSKDGSEFVSIAAPHTNAGGDDDFGLLFKEAAKHYTVAAPVSLAGGVGDEPLVVQYEVRFQDGLTCGGAYVKLLEGSPELASVDGATRHVSMFGPDICGATNKVHLIFTTKNPGA